ncbi:MAG: hypothetical protein JNM62_03725 [Flavobacteriales bacterium]|nr:hypothetical protein [Flavobacteriales bacterium]
MRYGALVPLVLLCVLKANAQPGPPSLLITLAEDRDALRPLVREVQVVQYFREHQSYINADGSWLGPLRSIPIQRGPLVRDEPDGWIVYRPSESVAVSYLLITSGADTMRVDLPGTYTRIQLHAMQRSTRDTPEVLRFRAGHFVLEELAFEPWSAKAAQRIVDRMKETDLAEYRRSVAAEERRRREMKEAETKKEAGVPPVHPKQERSVGLKKVELERVSGDTVCLRVTGRVTLDGGCASNDPFVALEMHTDSGWVERLPMPFAQMDCGMPWADWEDRALCVPPLRWWASVRQPEGKKELLPGRYRIVLLGGDGEQVRSKAFELD